MPTTPNPNVQAIVTDFTFTLQPNGPQLPAATSLGQGVTQFVTTLPSGEKTIVGATQNADFNGVLAAINLLPSQTAVNNSYKQITAEPYASFVSVGLESLVRFRRNALALAVAPEKLRLTEQRQTCAVVEQKAPGATAPQPA
jgi:hypothetical protein